jgi:hypothetical protein
MRRVDERLLSRLTAGLTSGVLAASAVLAAGLAREHMALCGAGSAAHCGWCLVSVGLALAALAALAATLQFGPASEPAAIRLHRGSGPDPNASRKEAPDA